MELVCRQWGINIKKRQRETNLEHKNQIKELEESWLTGLVIQLAENWGPLRNVTLSSIRSRVSGDR